jgi:hypothetical protein
MFVIIAIGAQLGGSARGATACGAAHAAGRGASLVSRTSCPYSSPGTDSLKRHVTNSVERRVPCQSSSSGMTQRNC